MDPVDFIVLTSAGHWALFSTRLIHVFFCLDDGGAAGSSGVSYISTKPHGVTSRKTVISDERSSSLLTLWHEVIKYVLFPPVHFVFTTLLFFYSEENHEMSRMADFQSKVWISGFIFRWFAAKISSQETGYPDWGFSSFLLGHPGKCRDSSSKWAKTTSFHVLSNTLLLNHAAIHR
jgi:hypothetical protein